MQRGFLLVLTLILLLSTSVPVSVRGQDNQLANARSIAISEAEAAIAEAEEAVAAAAEVGGDTHKAEAYLNEARESLELAIAAGRNAGDDDVLFLANEAREFANHARNLAEEERNSQLNQGDDEGCDQTVRPDGPTAFPRGRLLPAADHATQGTGQDGGDPRLAAKTG